MDIRIRSAREEDAAFLARIMLMAGRDSIRDVIAFPKTTSATCLMMKAPSTVGDHQLAEVGVKSHKEE